MVQRNHVNIAGHCKHFALKNEWENGLNGRTETGLGLKGERKKKKKNRCQ